MPTRSTASQTSPPQAHVKHQEHAFLLAPAARIREAFRAAVTGTAVGDDADGNRTSVTNGTTTTFGFDYEDRLTPIGSSVSYDYIGASTDRYSKTVSGTTTQFLYDGGNVDEELQGTTVTAEYGAYAQKQSGTVCWELQDGQPSTRQLLNSSQTVVAG